MILKGGRIVDNTGARVQASIIIDRQNAERIILSNNVEDGTGFFGIGEIQSDDMSIKVLPDLPGYVAPSFHLSNLPSNVKYDGQFLLIELEPSAIPFDDDMSLLHIEGRYFVNASGKKWYYRGCSEFCLLKQFVFGGIPAIAPFVNERLRIFGKGVVFRTFRYAGNNNLFAMNPDWSTGRLDVVVEFCRYMKSRGARIDFTAGDARLVLPNQQEQQAEMNAFYEAISNETNVFFQSQNEADVNGMDVRRVKPPSGKVLRSSGYYNIGPNSPYGNQWGDRTLGGSMLDFMDYHSIRDGLDTDYPKAIWDPVEQMYDEFFGKPIVDEEPFGFKEVLEPNRRSNRPKDAKRLARERSMWDVGVNFHSDNGRDGQLFTPTVLKCAEEFVKGLAR